MQQKKLYQVFFSFVLCMMLVWVAHPTQTLAQERKSATFTDTAGDKGVANYGFRLLEGDSILTGRFDFLSQRKDSLSPRVIFHKRAEGNYSSNLKSGFWRYEQGYFEVDVLGIEQLRAQTSTTGELLKVEGRMSEGNAVGLWSLSKASIRDGSNQEIVQSAEAVFEEGFLKGSFKFKEEVDTINYRIEGQFSEGGFFDGTWFLTYDFEGQRYEEERIYDEGILIEVFNVIVGKPEPVYNIRYRDAESKLKAVRAGADTINFKLSDETFDPFFDDGYRRTMNEEKAQRMALPIIERSLDAFFNENRPYFSLPGINQFSGGFTRRFEYVYPPEDAKKTVEIGQRLVDLEILYDSLKNDRVFRINKERTDSMAFAYAYMNWLSLRLDQIRRYIDLETVDAFRFEDRYSYYNKGLPGFIRFDTIKYTFEDSRRAVSLDMGVSVNSGVDFVSQLDHYKDSLVSYSLKVNAFVSRELDAIRMETLTADLQDQMIQYVDSADLLYLPFKNQEIRRERSGLGLISRDRSIRSEIGQSLHDYFLTERRRRLINEYSRLESDYQKQQKANELIQMMQVLIEVHPFVARIDAMPNNLDEAFTRYSYNPFLEGQDMESRIKRRIYQRGVEQLLSHLLEELRSERDITKVKDKIAFLIRYEIRMLEIAEMSDEETEDLERKLRRTDKVSEIINYLEIPKGKEKDEL
ncbi:MAG: hypothetical protein LAT68_02285 [Cyclobacteriaceae bacterium]|nr:hypothetical protein [Cyclobacteriaceae bacterium]